MSPHIRFGFPSSLTVNGRLGFRNAPPLLCESPSNPPPPSSPPSTGGKRTRFSINIRLVGVTCFPCVTGSSPLSPVPSYPPPLSTWQEEVIMAAADGDDSVYPIAVTNCGTRGVVYLMVCSCRAFYVGKIIRELRQRLGDHLYYSTNGKLTTVGRHIAVHQI